MWQNILGGNEGALSPARCLARLGVPGGRSDGGSVRSEPLPFLAMEEVCEVSPAKTQQSGELGRGPSFAAALTASRGPPVVTCHPVFTQLVSSSQLEGAACWEGLAPMV